MRVLLSGYYGKGNGGDEALLATLLQMLPDGVTPVVLSGNPGETQQRYGVEAYERMRLASVVKAMRSCEGLIWGGGSLIQDATSRISPFYYNGMMATAQKLHMKTVAWAQGIGPIHGRVTRKLARQNFAGCTGVSVRDRKSADLLTEWNIPHILAPDPVWAMQSVVVSEIKALPSPRIAVTLRNHPDLTPQRLENLTRALVDLQAATGAFMILLPFQKAQDYAIAQAIQPAFKNNSTILCFEEPQVLKGVFRDVDMAIGMRLHSLIMAASEGCRAFALSYDPKINRLMEDLNMPGWDLSALPDDSKTIYQAWWKIYTEGASLPQDKIQMIINSAQQHRQLLAKVFAS